MNGTDFMKKLTLSLAICFSSLAQVNNANLVGTTGNVQTNIDARLSTNSVFVDSSRANIIVNPTINRIFDTNTNSASITLTASGGTLPNKIGTSTEIIAGFTASGAIMARRVYYVSGTTGTLTYNAVAYNPGDTFTGVYGTKTYSVSGNCVAKNNISRQPDSSYVDGQTYVASITGGYDHLNNQIAGTIAGGGHNELRSAGNHATISGGSYNLQKAGLYSFIGGGSQNYQSQDFGVIVGGWGNTIASDNVNVSDESVIVSGQENEISDVAYGFIGTGLNNRLLNPNNVTVAYNSIINGTGNTISAGIHNAIQGINNTITGDSTGYNLARGNGNTISGVSTYVFSSGSSIVATNSTRVFLSGAANTVTNMTGGTLFGDNTSITSASYGYSFGNANTINGTDYTFMFGRSLSGSDSTSPATTVDYGFAAGYQAVLRSFGQRVDSNGNLNTTINVQRSRYLASRRYAHVTGALSTDVRLNNVDQYILVPTNSVWVVSSTIVGSLSDGSKYGAWSSTFAVRDSSGSLSVLGSPTVTTIYDGHSATWSVAPAIRSTPRGVTISVTALNGETVNWSATFDSNELSGAW